MKVKLLVNSIDRTGALLEEEWDIERNEGPTISTISFVLDDPSLAFTVDETQDVIIEDDADATVRFFGGIVANVLVVPDGGIGREWRVDAQDFKLILDRATFTKDYVNQTDKAIIQDAFTEAGITEINTADEVETGRTIDRIVFRGATLRQMMESIAAITGFVWDVDPFKKLHYHEEGRVRSSFDFASLADEVTTFPFYNAQRIKEIGQFNSVEVVGGSRLSDDVVNRYSGDGTRTVFNLTRDHADVSGEEYKNLLREPAKDFALVDLAPTNNAPLIQVNTGTDASPVFSDRTVGIETEDALGVGGIDVIWKPKILQMEFNVAPPNFANNSWRIRGRYLTDATWKMKDEARIASEGREFKKVLIEPSTETDDEAHDVAAAFLRDQGPKDRYQLTFNKDGLNPCESVKLTDSQLDIATTKLFLVKRLSMRLIGGTQFEYTALLGKGFELPRILAELRAKAGSHAIPKEAAVTIIRMVTGKVGLVNIVVSSVSRGPSPYFVENTGVRRNRLPNPSFEKDLVGWTEIVPAAHTATTKRVFTQAKYGVASLEIDITASTAEGDTQRRSDPISAVSGEIYSASVEVKVTAITGGGLARFFIQWHTVAEAVLQTDQIDQASVTTNFVTLTLDNKTAPATTDHFHVYVMGHTAASGDLVTCYGDGVLLEKASAVGAYFDGFQGNGFWQGTEDASESILDPGGKDIIAGIFKAS